MLGYSRDELLQSFAADIESSYTAAAILEILESAKQTLMAVEGVHRRKDGTTLPVEMRLTSLAPTTPGQILAIVRDVSERTRLQQERAEEARRKDEFLALMGHELRNPLAAIHTAVHVLTGGPAPALRARMEEMIGRQTMMMRRLVDDLLELERITHGHIELKPAAINLAECLHRAVGAVQATVASRHQELVLHLPVEWVQFAADGTRLDQIVGNLLANASKYTPQGGRIELSGAIEASEVVIRCKDNGQGISPEYLQKIFEPFARGQKTELGYGEASVGLGLALVKQLTELHGGTISVESEGMGLGSVFSVRLPLVAAAPPAHFMTDKSVRPLRRSRSVVIVEDNPSVARVLRAALEQAGHSVHLFADGPSTLAGMPGLTPDTLLIDIGLPGMDGYELAARLRQQTNLKNVRFVAVSGFGRQQHTRDDQFDRYFTKPVEVPALLALLDED
jgi:signal transduction histidine kinase